MEIVKRNWTFMMSFIKMAFIILKKVKMFVIIMIDLKIIY